MVDNGDNEPPVKDVIQPRRTRLGNADGFYLVARISLRYEIVDDFASVYAVSQRKLSCKTLVYFAAFKVFSRRSGLRFLKILIIMPARRAH